MDGNDKKKQAICLCGLPEPANDCRPVFERLKDYAHRGMDEPETLSRAEIGQMAFALSLYLEEKT